MKSNNNNIQEVTVMTNESAPVRSQKSEMIIGSTRYIVTTHFNEAARETAEQKLLRLVTDRIAGEMISKAIP